MSNNYEKIEQLMLLKDFEALNFQEREFIQDLMSPEAYQQQRTVLIESKRILSQKTPLKGANLSSLQTHFKTTHSISSSWKLGKIPIYQAVLFATLVGFVVWCWRPVLIETKVQKEVVYIPKVDTVFQETFIEKEKVVYKTKTIRVPVLQIDTVYVPIIDKEQFYQEKDSPTIFAKQNPKGKTMKDMGDLMHFVVGAN
jgi:hypothetical protein